VPDPYYNEPGWEKDRGTPRGEKMSKVYNQKIRNYTVSASIRSHLIAILGNQNQYIEFESAMIKHFLEKSFLIQKELGAWVKEDRSLAPQVSNICELLEQLARRERGQNRSKRSRAVAKNSAKLNDPIVLDEWGIEETCGSKPKKACNEPIVLDEWGIEETCGSKPKKSCNGPLKSGENIEIDLSDDEEKKERKKGDNAKPSSCSTGGAGGLVDLT